KAIVRSGQYANFPRSNPSHISGCHRIAGRSACLFRKVDSRGRSDETSLHSRHYNWNIKQMVEMPMSNQNRVRSGCEMSHSFSNVRHVRSNARTKRNAQKIDARKIGINNEGMALEFELVAIRAEVSYAHSAVRGCAGILGDQVSIRIQPRAQSLRGESEKKKKRAFQSLRSSLPKRRVAANCKFA